MIRFDEVDHAYYLHGVRVPSVTQMLRADNMIDATWFTAEARERGSAVHAALAAHLLGGLERDEYDGPFRPWFLAGVDAIRLLRPDVLTVEEPWIEPRSRFGCRVDIAWKLHGAYGVCEWKTGAPQKWHGVQTALQAIAAEHETGIPATSIKRHAIYLREDGRWQLHDFQKTLVSDFGRARSVIARWAARMEPWTPPVEW